MFSVLLRDPHRLAELPNFGAAEPTIARRAGEAAYAFAGLLSIFPRRTACSKAACLVDMVSAATPSPPVVLPPRLPTRG